MKKISTNKKIIIKNYTPVGDEGYYAKQWNVIKDDIVYNLYFEEETGKIYLVITNYNGKHEKILINTIEPYDFWAYEITSDEDYIYAIYYTFKSKIYFLKYDIKQKTFTSILIDTLDKIYESTNISNLYCENGFLYFIALEHIETDFIPSKLHRWYIYLYIYNGTNWNKHEINGNDNKLKFIDKSFMSIKIEPNIVHPLYLYDSCNYTIRIFNENANYFNYFFFPREVGSFGRNWQSNISLQNYNTITPSWTRSKAYEPIESCYNGDLPRINYDYKVGDIIRFYDGNWQNIYYGTRNDYVLQCISAGKSGTEWNENLLKEKYPGNTVFWGNAIFRLYVIRSYIIFYSIAPHKTGTVEPSVFRYGAFISPTSVIQDNNCYYYGGQVRPLLWLPNQIYKVGEYIVENDMIFYCYESTAGNYGKTGNSKPDFSNCLHKNIINDNEITWKCFDFSKYIYENANPMYLYYYDEKYLWDNKIYFFSRYNFPDNVTIKIYDDYEESEITLDEDKKFDMKSLNLTFNKEYNIAFKKSEGNSSSFRFPFFDSPDVNHYPSKIHLLCNDNYIFINFCIYSIYHNHPNPGIPYDTIILNKNNLNIVNKSTYLPIDDFDEYPNEYYYQEWRTPVLVKDKIYFSENVWDTWEEQVRCFKIIDDSLSLEWVKSLPEITTYNVNWYFTSDGNYLYFFFNYDNNEFILKLTDLNGENGQCFLIKCKDLNANRYDDIYVHNFIIGKKILIPVIYYGKEDRFYSILKKSIKGNLMPFMWFYWWTPKCGDEYDNNVYSQTQKGEDPKRGEEWQS